VSTHQCIWNRDATTRIGECDIDWDEDCTVEFEVTGKYLPAKLSPPDDAHPAEGPELEIQSVMDSQNEDIFERLTSAEVNAVEAAAWDAYGEIGEQSRDDYDEDAAYERQRQKELDDQDLTNDTEHKHG